MFAWTNGVFVHVCVYVPESFYTDSLHARGPSNQKYSSNPSRKESRTSTGSYECVCAHTRERVFCVCVLEQACPCVSAVLLFHQQVPVWSFACRTVTGCKCDQYEWEKDREGVIERAQQNQPQIKPWLNPSPPISHVLALLCPCIIDKMYGERWAQLQSVILLAFCAVEARK